MLENRVRQKAVDYDLGSIDREMALKEKKEDEVNDEATQSGKEDHQGGFTLIFDFAQMLLTASILYLDIFT